VSWLLAFLGFAALIVLHEAGHFVAAKAVGMRVERFALFFPPMLFTVKRGETEYGIGAIPLGGYVRISGMNPYEELPPEVEHRAYYRQPPWKRVVVILAGPAVNLLIAFVIFAVLFMTQGTGKATDRVETITKGSPAATVLQPGDRLVAVDGRRGAPDELRAQISSHRCAGDQVDGCLAERPARLTIVRDGQTRQVEVRPRYDASPDIERTLVGFAFAVRESDPYGPVGAAGQSVSTMWDATTRTVSAIGRLFVSEQARKDVSGVVGSYETTRQTIEKSGFVQTMSVLALISLSLGIINLFPFLPLDGGHVLWAVVEKVRGRAVPFRVLERVSVVGFALVGILFLIGLTNDIGTLSNGGFRPQ
jgi:regulator of sigma E protease